MMINEIGYDLIFMAHVRKKTVLKTKEGNKKNIITTSTTTNTTPNDQSSNEFI